ncbi:MAG: hypothetical protein NTX82_04710 [Candidatus Parcubacteria bacterium]|nr:hypothetical protein [Candidatus Parcubacteria bacterium]
MKCTNCQNEIVENLTRCNYCGQEVKIAAVAQAKPKKNIWISVIILAIFIVIGIIGRLSEKGAQKNDEGIKLLDSGSNYNQAIANFEESLKNLKNDDERLTVLKNMGYAYWINNEPIKAAESFKQALVLAQPDSSDFYLVSGEIALLSGDAKAAETNYLQAAGKKSDDFQANSSLGVFYLGIDEVAKDYADFPKALIYNQKAYEVNPDSDMTKENLANNYFVLENYQQAVDLYLQTSLANKSFNNYMLGLSYYGLGDEANAYKYLKQAVAQGFEPEAEVTDFLNNYQTEN